MNWLIISVLTLVLSACGWLGDDEVTPVVSTTARSGMYTVLDFIRTPGGTPATPRAASSLLAVYTTLFLTDLPPLPVQSARRGVTIANSIIRGQSNVDEGETLALLRELGGLLQIDVPELLNRSVDREETLEQYLDQLVNVASISQRKAVELEAAEEQQRELVRDERDVLRDLERQARDAQREERYEDASQYQQSIGETRARVALLEAEEERLQDLQRIYEDYLEIAEERIIAIRENKRLLIAGLAVVEVPGIEDLRLLETESEVRERRRNAPQGGGTFNSNGLDPLNLFGN